MLSHEAFVRTWMVTGRIWATTPEDRLWSALPLFHVTALGTVTWVLGIGATFFSDYSFDADRTLATLRDEQITQFYPAYQPVMEAVLAHPEFDTLRPERRSARGSTSRRRRCWRSSRSACRTPSS